ncbi:MAG: class I adenylate cyclase [Proteobacteria bacterium]|nr:class I adenylate cyclase [Pseudomonadota bacterium]
MIRKIITRNKMKFLEYNDLRKQMFSECSPKDSEMILYLLPWLLSVNHQDCPGYLPDLDIPFRVHNVATEKEIRQREKTFKDMFGIHEKGSLLKLKPVFSMIQGLYTIGSIGTISQTPESDCDIWVCFDGDELDANQIRSLHQKLYLIKEWLNQNCKIPVYFFVSDIRDIRECRFGSVDDESSGSTQTHVLKEEFYRTCVLICGKIPLWWVCYDSRVLLTYDRVLNEIRKIPYGDDDLLDLGNLENVEEHEYFGAALWQFHKALERPLKSIIKMMLLKMQLDASSEELVCHKFRQHIMIKNLDNMIHDPSVFSMFFVMNYYQGKSDSDTITFIKECFYLRCGIKPYSKKNHFKKKLSDIFFSQFDIDKDVRGKLDRFSKWDLETQILFGKRLFKLLLQIYRDISKSHSGVASKIDREDLTVIGRKIQAFYEVKEHKVAILPKPMGILNVPGLIFQLNVGKWYVYPGNTSSGHIVSDMDILFAIAFIVQNDLFETGRSHMIPNSSSVSLPEIENLSIKIREFIHQHHTVIRGDYLKKASISKMLVVISFEEEPWEKSTSNIGLIYKNSWGEIFVRRFYTEKRLRTFLDECGCREGQVLADYYLQKKCINYSMLLDRVKKIIEG